MNLNKVQVQVYVVSMWTESDPEIGSPIHRNFCARFTVFRQAGDSGMTHRTASGPPDIRKTDTYCMGN